MKVVKKLNNNVAECIDGNGNQLIAFGKGIGFPKMPYEMKDLTTINMTFYKLNDHFEKIITELPENILNLSVEIVEMAQKELKGQLNPTLVFSLADHIHFAIQRMTNYQSIKLAFSHEIEKLYPEENKLAERAVRMINQSLNVHLPKNEITSIAVHFLNSQSEFKISQEEALIEEIVNNVTKVMEEELSIIIDKDEFNYNRFRTHMVYYLKQIRNGEQFLENNEKLLQSLMQDYPDIHKTAEKVREIIYQSLAIRPSNDELVYLMLHINRLYKKNIRR